MCPDPAESTVGAMTHSNRIYLALAAAVAAVLCAAALWPAAGHAAGRTETIRAFSKTVSITVTKPDGTVITQPPFDGPAAGDVLDVFDLVFRGDHTRHSKHWIGTDHVQCVFSTAPEPDCVSHVALGGSMLIFRGNPGTLIAGVGRFQGATGRVLSNEEVPGGTDTVTKIKLAARHP
jgi:hypothetical protein